MSDTPRTDAFYAEAYKGRDGEWITLTPDSKAWELARQLERELQGVVDVCDLEIRRRMKLEAELADSISRRREALLLINNSFLYEDADAPLASTILTRADYELLVKALREESSDE